MSLRRSAFKFAGSAGAVLMAAGVFAGSAAAATGASADSMTLAPNSLPLTLEQTAPIAGGDVVTTWTGGGLQVKVAGRPGSSVQVTQSATGASVVVSAPAGASLTTQQYANSGRSLLAEQQAVDPEAALANPILAAAAAVRPKAVAAAANGPFNTVCADVNSGGSLPINEGSACLVQTWLQTGSASCGCWYLSNVITSTGVNYSTDTDLTNLSAWYYWGNGHTYTRGGWQPSATINEGSPTTYTLSAAYGGFGASVQELQYPATLSPQFPNTMANAAFGSNWYGSNNDYTYDSANSVAIVNTGVGSPGAANVGVGLQWTN